MSGGVERGLVVNARQHIILLLGGQFRRFCPPPQSCRARRWHRHGDEVQQLQASTLSTIA